jgi:hypothetical protein
MKEGKTKGSFGVPALTYIGNKNIERKLGRSLESESNARPLSWGKLLEKRVFELLGLEYSLCSDETLKHPDFDCWFGSPDGIKHDGTKTVIDIKAPYTLLSFATLVDCSTVTELRSEHRDGDKYYWQLVSNAILTGCDYAELIVYCPYQSELQEIKLMAEGDPSVYWLWSSQDEELPFLIEGGYYRNLNILRFQVSQEDKDALTARVREAAKLLVTHELVTV